MFLIILLILFAYFFLQDSGLNILLSLENILYNIVSCFILIIFFVVLFFALFRVFLYGSVCSKSPVYLYLLHVWRFLFSLVLRLGVELPYRILVAEFYYRYRRECSTSKRLLVEFLLMIAAFPFVFLFINSILFYVGLFYFVTIDTLSFIVQHVRHTFLLIFFEKGLLWLFFRSSVLRNHFRMLRFVYNIKLRFCTSVPFFCIIIIFYIIYWPTIFTLYEISLLYISKFIEKYFRK